MSRGGIGFLDDRGHLMAACSLCTCLRVVWVTNTVSCNIVFHRPGRFASVRCSLSHGHNRQCPGKVSKSGVGCGVSYAVYATLSVLRPSSFAIMYNRFFSPLGACFEALTRHEHTHRSVSDSHDSPCPPGPRSPRAGGPGVGPGGGRVWSVV